ncbi:MAG: hypothetical protein HY866_07770 [Chloroflexi bacterium]|nr:hypothetical protein [Chloroflexota bacterium]
MRNKQQVLRVLWIGLLVMSLVLPSWALAAQDEPEIASPLTIEQAADALRYSTSQADLLAGLADQRAILDKWSAQIPVRPPVDPAQQSQTVADWTVLVFIAADNNLEAAGLFDMNEMEAVGSTSQVNIITQIDRSTDYVDWDGDWTETRRYYVQQDQDADAITSPVIENLGETNSGDAEAIADFAIWGITNYPAQKYALVLWDHGGAWITHSSDEETGDDISLPELTVALDRVKAETGLDKFELLGFDMCLMGQLEVFQTIAPYARYSVGAEETEPGAGWFYLFFEQLVNNPAMTGAELGPHIVEYFMAFLREALGDQDVFGLGAVDLAQADVVTAAVDQFTATISANPEAVISAVADARNNTISYGGFDDPEYVDIWSSVDLYQFAELLNQVSTEPEVQTASQGLMQAVDSLVLFEDNSEPLADSHGLAVYFPRTIKAYKIGAFNERYPDEMPPAMDSWIEFLNVYHSTAATTVTTSPNTTTAAAPGIQVIGVYPEVASIYQPAVVSLEVTGRDILQVNYAVTYIIDENERAVLDFDYLVSRVLTASGADIVDWSDGVTSRSFTWDAEVPMLTDGTTSTYALLIPNQDNPNSATVNGQYTSVRGGEPVKAQMVFDLNLRQSTALWGINETESGGVQPFEVQVEAGDQFQPLWLTMDADNNLVGSSFGDVLTLQDNQSLTFQKVPAPTGEYAISFGAENVAGETTISEVVIQVNNDGLDPALRGYTDLSYGVNFLYPSNWLRPRFTPDGTRLFTADLSTNTLLSLYPYTDVTSAEETDAAIRESWNQLEELQVINQRAVEINGLPAYVTDYSYSFRGEARLGAVIAIYVPDQAVGYAFDLDAPASNPAPAQQALEALVGSINYFEVEAASGESGWQTVTAANGLVSFPVPATWEAVVSGEWAVYGPVENQAVFVAITTAPTAGQTNEQLAQSWVDQLQGGVQGLEILATEPYYVGGREWQLVVFTYQGEVKMAGAFFVTSAGDQDYTFWIEAPDDEFDQLYADVFGVSVGGFVFNG